MNDCMVCYVAYVPYQSTMAQPVSRLRHLVLLLLLWLVDWRYTKSQAALVDALKADEDVVKVNGNAIGVDGIGGGGVGVAVGGGILASVAHECFARYLQESHAAGDTYATAYQNCQHLGNVRNVKTVDDQQSVRKDVTMAMNDMCSASYACMDIESDLEFFQCNTRNSYAQTNRIMQVYFNATAAMLEMENDYLEKEKQILLCIIAVQRQYVYDTSNAYSKLMKCLKSN